MKVGEAITRSVGICEPQIAKGEIMLEKNESFTHCEDCPNPDSCLTECVINSYVNEDVAKIRGEDE